MRPPLAEDTVSAAKNRALRKLNRWRDLLLRKGWALALGAAAGLAITAAISPPDTFVSLGRMIVSIKLAIPEGSVYNEELSNFLGTQAALMQSAAVLARAQSAVLARNAAFTNQSVSLKVSISPKTSIFILQAAGRDAAYAQAYLQAVMQEFINLKRDLRAQTSDTTVAGLSEEVLRLEKELRKDEADLVEFQKSNSVVLLQEQGNSAGSYLAALQQRRAGLKAELDLMESLTVDQSLERSVAADPGTAEIGGKDAAGLAGRMPASAADNADYLKAKQQLLMVKAEQEDLAQFLRPKHPKMIALAEDIARRGRLLEIFRRQSADQLAGRRATLVLEVQALEKQIAQWDAQALEISRKTAEFQRLKGAAQRVQTLYERLLATLQALDVTKEISPESVTILEPASPALPDRAAGTRRLVTASVLCVGLSLALLLLLDRLDDRVHSLAELDELFDEELLAQIPREKSSAAGDGLLQPNDPRHGFQEAYRSLRSALLCLGGTEPAHAPVAAGLQPAGPAASLPRAPTDPAADSAPFEANSRRLMPHPRPKTLLLTSSVPHEGKSLTASNLAIVLAGGGAWVLLVDADLRKGGLHGRFGLPESPGLGDVLRGGCAWESAARPTTYPNLTLLARGNAGPQCGELFLSPELRNLLRAVSSRFDFVVLDTAPVLAVDDVTSLAPHLDAVLFVLRASHTPARVARAALAMLHQRHARVLGLVFNAVHPGSAEYYYYKYEDYYAGPKA
jgi:capsular exopolysaccharide synthesis family protein